jgi:lipoprotein Spr
MSYNIREIATKWLHTPYKYGGDSHSGVDCSHFIWEVLKEAGHPHAEYVTARDMPHSGHYSRVHSLPAAGDIVHFDGPPAHVGIIVDPTQGLFIGAQSHGVEQASYKTGYWSHKNPTFYRYTGH